MSTKSGYRRPRFCALPSCGRSIDHKRPQARWCDERCANRGFKHFRRLKAMIRRPRCMICDRPITYGQGGTRLSSVTCGDRKCVIRRYNWFGKAS